MQKKILFYTIGTRRMPSTRARVYVYCELLQKWGFKFKIIHAVNDLLCKYRIEGRRNSFFIKPFFLLNAVFRLFLFVVCIPFYNYIVVQKILFPAGFLPVISKLLAGKTSYFDVDDLIYKFHQADKKNPDKEVKLKSKFKANMFLYDKIICSTQYLKNDIISTFNLSSDFIKVIHDPINTDYFISSGNRKNIVPVMGWLGTPSNTQYILECLKEVNKLRKEGYDFDLLLSGANIEILKKELGENFAVKIIKWTLNKEKELYDLIDIGLMPIPSDDWSNMKGGYKLMLYMSMGKIAIASDVGLNKNIVDDGENGFLVSNRGDWYKKIKYILDNYNNLEKIRHNARKKIEDNFSLNLLGKNYLELFS